MQRKVTNQKLLQEFETAFYTQYKGEQSKAQGFLPLIMPANIQFRDVKGKIAEYKHLITQEKDLVIAAEVAWDNVDTWNHLEEKADSPPIDPTPITQAVSPTTFKSEDASASSSTELAIIQTKLPAIRRLHEAMYKADVNGWFGLWRSTSHKDPSTITAKNVLNAASGTRSDTIRKALKNGTFDQMLDEYKVSSPRIS